MATKIKKQSGPRRQVCAAIIFGLGSKGGQTQEVWLVARKSRDGLRWTFPGGVYEPGLDESQRACVEREVAEELERECLDIRHYGSCIALGASGGQEIELRAYIVKLNGEPQLCGNEHVALALFDWSKIDESRDHISPATFKILEKMRRQGLL